MTCRRLDACHACAAASRRRRRLPSRLLPLGLTPAACAAVPAALVLLRRWVGRELSGNAVAGCPWGPLLNGSKLLKCCPSACAPCAPAADCGDTIKKVRCIQKFILCCRAVPGAGLHSARMLASNSGHRAHSDNCPLTVASPALLPCSLRWPSTATSAAPAASPASTAPLPLIAAACRWVTPGAHVHGCMPVCLRLGSRAADVHVCEQIRMHPCGSSAKSTVRWCNARPGHATHAHYSRSLPLHRGTPSA